MTGRAADDLLALAAFGRGIDRLGCTLNHFDHRRLDQPVEHECRAGLALAAAAMTAMHRERLAAEAKADLAAGAVAFHHSALAACISAISAPSMALASW